MSDWTPPSSTHYSHFLGPLLKSMSVDDLVKEGARNAFEAELTRRQEEAQKRVNDAHYWHSHLNEQIDAARERFKHLRPTVTSSTTKRSAAEVDKECM